MELAKISPSTVSELSRAVRPESPCRSVLRSAASWLSLSAGTAATPRISVQLGGRSITASTEISRALLSNKRHSEFFGFSRPPTIENRRCQGNEVMICRLALCSMKASPNRLSSTRLRQVDTLKCVIICVKLAEVGEK